MREVVGESKGSPASKARKDEPSRNRTGDRAATSTASRGLVLRSRQGLLNPRRGALDPVVSQARKPGPSVQRNKHPHTVRAFGSDAQTVHRTRNSGTDDPISSSGARLRQGSQRPAVGVMRERGVGSVVAVWTGACAPHQRPLRRLARINAC